MWILRKCLTIQAFSFCSCKWNNDCCHEFLSGNLLRNCNHTNRIDQCAREILDEQIRTVGVSRFSKELISSRIQTDEKFFFSAATTLATAGMFAFQTDDIRRGFRVTWGISFYMVIVAVILTILLAAMSFSDHQILRQSRRVSTQRKGSFNRKHSESKFFLILVRCTKLMISFISV